MVVPRFLLVDAQAYPPYGAKLLSFQCPAVLLAHRDIDYAVQGVVRGDTARAALIFERLELLVGVV